MTPTNPSVKRLIIWRDIQRAVRVWQEGEATMNFEVLGLAGFDADSDAPLYEPASEGHMITDPDEAEVEIEGFIRFDGCSHWRHNARVMQHICGRDDLANLNAMQHRLYDEAEQLIGSAWCG